MFKKRAVFWSLLFGFLGTGKVALGESSYRVISSVTLRVKEQGILYHFTDLDAGSMILLDTGRREGEQYYEEGGERRFSRSEWYRGVTVLEGLTRSEQRRLGDREIYMSVVHRNDIELHRREENHHTGGRYRRIQVSTNVTLRERRQGYLKTVLDLEEGDTIEVNTQNNVGRMRYQNQAGNVQMSSRAWFQGVKIISAAGVSSSRIRQINRKKLYVSVDVTEAVQSRPRVPRGSGNCYQKFLNSGVPRRVLDVFLGGVKRYRRQVSEHRWGAIADYSKNSRRHRFYLMNMKDCRVFKEYVAHGSGKQGGVHRGDPDNDGKLNRCRWKGNSLNMTRPGFQIIRGWHQSQKKWPYLNRAVNGKGLKLHGLESFNREVFSAAVVMHESGTVRNSSRIQGRSFGCPMFAKGRLKRLLMNVTGGRLNKGTLILQYAPQCGVG